MTEPDDGVDIVWRGLSRRAEVIVREGAFGGKTLLVRSRLGAHLEDLRATGFEFGLMDRIGQLWRSAN